jgi:putative hydrolase of the HAD superfamily
MIPAAEIQAVTFDVGGTLIEPWPSVGQVYAAIAARHGLHVSAPALNREFATAWGALNIFHYTLSEWADLVDKTFRGATDKPLPPKLFAELYSHFGLAQTWHIFDDVLPALEQLASRGVKLGIISNWDERLRPLLRELKLHDYFETIIISSEIGFTKPSPVIFEMAAEKLALPPAAILHVGDSMEADFEGARSASLHGLLLRRGVDSVDDHEIKSLLELSKVK